MSRHPVRLAALLMTLLSPAWSVAQAQGYRLRLDTRVQRASYRGVAPDSILASEAVTAPTGGLQTADGFAVRCPPTPDYCFYFRPGPAVHGGPLVSSADLTLWGLGMRGLSVRVHTRLGVDLGRTDSWPGTEPAAQLLEAYAEYAGRAVTARAGRQLLVDRFGFSGFDGGKATARIGSTGVDVEGYAGLGLARATALPVTSPVLDPLDEFQPRRRQLVAGAALGYAGRLGTIRADYRREIDRESRNFASERAALAVDLRPGDRWSLSAGADYDFANTWVGNADALLRYIAPWVTLAGGARRYRPYFDLWTIWGAFSPVPYHALQASVWVRPLPMVELRGRWERYVYSDTETETPLADVDDDGWRFSVGAGYSPSPAWRIEAGYHEDYGPGASSHGLEASLALLPSRTVSLTAYGSMLERPLEFRFQQVSVAVAGVEAEWSPSERLRIAAGAAQYFEDRDRPDAAAFDWEQTRLHARVSLILRSDTDRLRLPPALRTRARPGTR